MKFIPNEVTVGDFVEYMNGLLAVDQEAISNLVLQRVQCNEQLADHETVQCGVSGDTFNVGFLGVINGLFGVDDNGFGFVVAVIEDGKIVRFLDNR